jgi:hypothetical protein
MKGGIKCKNSVSSDSNPRQGNDFLFSTLKAISLFLQTKMPLSNNNTVGR